MWSHGITFTHKVFDADGLALYFKAYLSDIEYEDESSGDADSSSKPATVEKMVNVISKQFIKDERLKYYTAGMNLYSYSCGMKKPEVEEMTNAEDMVRVADSELVYRETYSIGNQDKGNLIGKRYYKKNAGSKQ